MREEYIKWYESLITERDPRYYHNLLKYSALVMEDLETLKQHVVAKRINLPPATLSTFKPILTAYNEV